MAVTEGSQACLLPQLLAAVVGGAQIPWPEDGGKVTFMLDTEESSNGKDRICNFVLWRDGNGFVSDLEHLLGSWVFDTTNTGDFSKVLVEASVAMATV